MSDRRLGLHQIQKIEARHVRQAQVDDATIERL
jgi:hypothetical protein